MKNRDKILKKSKQYAIDNKDKLKEQRKQFRIDNKEKVRERENKKTKCECYMQFLFFGQNWIKFSILIQGTWLQL